MASNGYCVELFFEDQVHYGLGYVHNPKEWFQPGPTKVAIVESKKTIAPLPPTKRMKVDLNKVEINMVKTHEKRFVFSPKEWFQPKATKVEFKLAKDSNGRICVLGSLKSGLYPYVKTVGTSKEFFWTQDPEAWGVYVDLDSKAQRAYMAEAVYQRRAYINEFIEREKAQKEMALARELEKVQKLEAREKAANEKKAAQEFNKRLRELEREAKKAQKAADLEAKKAEKATKVKDPKEGQVIIDKETYEKLMKLAKEREARK